MKLSHTRVIVLSGVVWLLIGLYLLQLGLGLILAPSDAHPMPLVGSLAPYVGGAVTAALLFVVFALYIGYFKGRFALGKSAKRGVDRILTFPDPMPLKSIYSPQYYLLIGAMIALGISIKYMGLSNDVRGFIDIIIGSALINGAVIYFRLAQAVSKTR